MRDWDSSHFVALISLSSGDLFAFLHISCSHSLYVCSNHLEHLSHVLDVNPSQLGPPACFLCCRGCPFTSPSVWGPDWLLGLHHRSILVQMAWEIIGACHTSGFCVFWDCLGEYFPLCTRFPPNLTTFLLDSILTFCGRCGLFLGSIYI